MPYATVGAGIEYFYEDRGSGVPVVLLPGWGLTHQIFEPQARGLHESYRVITLDLRGCGLSSKPEWGYTISQIAADVAGFIDGLGLHDVVLVGWSLGGNIAAECSLTYPGRIAGLVSVAAGLPKWTDSDGFALGNSHEKVLSWIAGLQRHRLAFLQKFVRGWFLEESDAMGQWMFYQLSQASWFIDDIFRDLVDHDMRERLHRVAVPTAFFHGEHDLNAPLALADECCRLLPEASLEVFERSAHTPFLEEPEEFNTRLAAFVGASVGGHRL